MDWKSSLGCFSQEHTLHKVGDKELRFRPVSVGAAFKLREFQGVISSGLAILFTDTSTDVSKKTADRGVHSSDVPGGLDYENETEVGAISPELAAQRFTQKQGAINEFLRTITKDEAKNSLGELILDSLRAHWGEVAKPSCDEFMREIELPMLVAMLIGVAKANKGVFGPFADKIEGLFNLKGAEIAGRIGPQTPTQAVTEASGTAGSVGKTIASGASNAASPQA